MNDVDKIDLLCNHCGKTFSTFLHQMEEHNAKVVCPCCGKPHDKVPAAKALKSPKKKAS